ncbi:MAG: hypothetical protein JRI42_07070 [Deltaproteobacteria bacterium]|nr:hypothetical protein [Deltaproteobacteria bacterium]
MDSYLIRIYRRDKENPEAIVGIIEEIGADRKEPFKNISELCDIIVQQRGNKARIKKSSENSDKSNT